ncbi:hypothetical protein LZ554_001673 [Drepanopeziza brunnea f. sp. 'monogermtubi']|nr:hypothetical protein LZ554_001673 [Drepanopeziza brunnea f. sp. 'monogermtubi']
MTNHDPAKALEYKEMGNKCFQAGDYVAAEAFYEKAIRHDVQNPLLYTNRSTALLKLLNYPAVVANSMHSIALSPHSMKAHFQLAQAQIELHNPIPALESAKLAHKYCVEELQAGGKGGSSLGVITELVLRCKGEAWAMRERERERERGGLLGDVLRGLDREMRAELEGLGEGRVEGVERLDLKVDSGAEGVDRGERRTAIEKKWEAKKEEVRQVWEKAGEEGESRRRKVPDWCVDNITFAVMVDPVVTKTGQSYDRSSIMEHLRRSPTDPLTREPLRAEDLRPNLALRLACEEFLEENGWAADW